MNILSNSINIFEDRHILKFLELDIESMEVQALRNALAKNLELFDQLSISQSSGSREISTKGLGQNYQSLMPDFRISKFFRKRGISHDDGQLGS